MPGTEENGKEPYPQGATLRQITTKTGMFVDGEWRSSEEGKTDHVLNPNTGEVIAEVRSGTEADVDRAVASARRAFEDGWSETTPAERARMLLKLAERIESDGEELARFESPNVGKPWGVSTGDAEFSADNLRFFAGAARLLEGKAAGEYARCYTSMIRREPVGVVASIAPWNYPLLMAAWKIGPALAAGNTVVLKPSELTPFSALRVAELAADVFPPGVLNVITGTGVPVGAGLVKPRGRGHGLPDGRRLDRQKGGTSRRGHRQARAPRARGEGPGDGFRGR
jgi:aminobutyraldehyde dehydrogenase